MAVVVAQLAERLLPTPKACCSNTIIGNFFLDNRLLLTLLKSKFIKKVPGKAQQFINNRKLEIEEMKKDSF